MHNCMPSQVAIPLRLSSSASVASALHFARYESLRRCELSPSSADGGNRPTLVAYLESIQAFTSLWSHATALDPSLFGAGNKPD